MIIRRKDAKNAKNAKKDYLRLNNKTFASFVLYMDVRMSRAQDAQKRPSLRQKLIQTKFFRW